uniref:Gap junction protein delta 4 n=1 Tax=Paramormyrops kingsleyae TaxID=1676925 RepID=A0A3B3SHX3_9TELE
MITGPECVTLTSSCWVAGKLWLVLMVLLRVLVLLFAGYPLYIDEPHQFSCNTIQPGCAGVCYDTFCPLSVLHFWVVQLTALCLPGAVFVVYVVHVVVWERGARASSASPADAVRVRSFTAAYLFHLLMSALLEAGFGVAQGFLFGFHVPRRVLCYELPCTATVDCYVSRATEKTILLRFMQAVGAVSFLLNVADLVCTTKLLATQKMKRKGVALMRLYKEEQSYVSAGGEELDLHLPLTLDLEGSPTFTCSTASIATALASSSCAFNTSHRLVCVNGKKMLLVMLFSRRFENCEDCMNAHCPPVVKMKKTLWVKYLLDTVDTHSANKLVT